MTLNAEQRKALSDSIRQGIRTRGAKGSTSYGSGKGGTVGKRICVLFDDADFDRIARYADLNLLSFAEAARTIMAWGLESDQMRSLK